jgi:predicted nucleic acid-binding protein
VPSPLVIDASAVIDLLVHNPLAARIDRAIEDRQLIAPDVLNAEVLHGLRGLERGGVLADARALKAVLRLAEGRIDLVPTKALIQDVWSLRHNLSAYDACYVALAQVLDCPLLTTDGPLTRAPRLGVQLIVV